MHSRIRAALAALLWLGGGAACQEPRPEAPVAALRESARGAERQGRFADAAALYLRLVAAEPDRPEWVAGAGRCLGRSGRFNDAINLLQEKQARFPGELDLPALLARTLLLKAESDPGALDPAGYLAEAARIVERVLQQNPRHQESLLILAQARYLLRDEAAAVAAAERAAEFHPDHPGSHILVGRIHADRFRRLLDEQRAAAEDDPGRAERTRELAHSRQRAEASYRRAIELDPARAFPHLALGDLCRAEGKAQPALQHFRRALLADPDTAVDHAWIAQTAGTGRRQFYLDLIDAYLAHPDHDRRKAAVLRFYLGLALYDEQQFAAAEPVFARVLADHPAYVNAAYYAAMAAWRMSDLDRAEGHAAAFAAASAPRFADIIRALPEAQRAEVTGMVRHLADRAYAAERVGHSRDLNHVLASLLDTADAWNNWALLCRDTGRPQDSLLGYRRALEKEPDSPQLLNDTAVILHYHVGDAAALQEARAMYQRAIAEADRVLADPAAEPVLQQLAARARSDAQANLKELAR